MRQKGRGPQGWKIFERGDFAPVTPPPGTIKTYNSYQCLPFGRYLRQACHAWNFVANKVGSRIAIAGWMMDIQADFYFYDENHMFEPG
jgi:hypothetical protein